MPERSWHSVCGECAAYGTARCAHRREDRRPDDCIAAICEGFIPAPEAQPRQADPDGVTRSCAPPAARCSRPGR